MNCRLLHKLRPRVATVSETPKSCRKLDDAGENPDAPQDTERSIGVIAATMIHFRQEGQFRGFSGSSAANRIDVDTVGRASRGVADEVGTPPSSSTAGSGLPVPSGMLALREGAQELDLTARANDDI